MTITDLSAKYKAQILSLAARHGARHVRVFGSTIRGEASAESDLDLLVDLEPGRSLFDLGGLQSGGALFLGKPVSVDNLIQCINQHVRKPAQPESIF